MNLNYENCISCGKCTANCVFLDKYKMNLKDYAQRPDLGYHCFLCGKCKSVCPVSIDGAKISLSMRVKPNKRRYLFLLAEKKNYLFKNYHGAYHETVLFPGCNFPAYYPKTMRLLSNMFLKSGIGTVYDCCGKPVSELGLNMDAKKSLMRIQNRLLESGVKEIIVLCPNCYHYFKDKLPIKVTSIYDKLKDMGMAAPVQIQNGALYIPCPEKEGKELFGSVCEFITGDIPLICDIQCCGAGGCAGFCEPELAVSLRDAFKNIDVETVYTYCATCSGMIQKTGKGTQHILCRILQSDEVPAVGSRSLLNRISFKRRTYEKNYN